MKTKTAKRGPGKRELINTGNDKRYVRRNAQGQFQESDDVGRSLSAESPKKSQDERQAGLRRSRRSTASGLRVFGSRL